MKNKRFYKSACALPMLAVPAIGLCLPAYGLASTTPDGGSVAATPAAMRSHPDSIVLYKGQVKLLDVHGPVRRVAVGNGNLVTASVVDQQLLLLAQAPGETTLVVWTDHGVALDTNIVVTAADRSETLMRLANGLPFVRGLKVEQAGGKLVVKGAVYSEQADQLRSALAGLDDVINLIDVDGGPKPQKTVHFRVQIINIDKNAMQNLGINWASQINGPQGALAFNAVKTGRYRDLPTNSSATFTDTPSAVGSAASGVFFGIATSITSMINLALTDGAAYIVAAPELNSRSGGKAVFLSGGEVPIPVSGAFGSTNVEYKPYGIKLEISPTVGGNGVISADLTTEISQPDYSNEVNGYPSFTTRRTSSQLSLKSGETLAISGLASNTSSNSTNKVPWLGNLPLLGSLFRSTNSQSDHNELVIFVTPTIVDASGPENEALLARARDIDSRFASNNGGQPLAGPVPAPTPTPAPTPAPAPAPAPGAMRDRAVPDIGRAPPPGNAAGTVNTLTATSTRAPMESPAMPAMSSPVRDPAQRETALQGDVTRSGRPVPPGGSTAQSADDTVGADFMFGDLFKH